MKKEELRVFVRQVLRESSSDKHLCLDGRHVPIESQDCFDDVSARIEDAIATRNLCSMQSDARDHYNGVLKVLRRKQRRSRKFINSENI